MHKLELVWLLLLSQKREKKIAHATRIATAATARIFYWARLKNLWGPTPGNFST